MTYQTVMTPHQFIRRFSNMINAKAYKYKFRYSAHTLYNDTTQIHAFLFAMFSIHQ